MSNMMKKSAQVMVKGVCAIAKANVACATGVMGYQPKAPQSLTKKK